MWGRVAPCAEVADLRPRPQGAVSSPHPEPPFAFCCLKPYVRARSRTCHTELVPLTATKLRQDIYEILDAVIATGNPVEIERKGRLLQIVMVQPPQTSRLSRIVKRPGLLCDPEDLVHSDWSTEWKPFL